MPDDEVKDLLLFWLREYDKRFQLEYDLGTHPTMRAQVEDIIEIYGDRSKRAMRLLLTSPALAWVKQVNLQWLANKANAAYLAPLLVPGGRHASAESKNRGSETSPTSVVVRRGRARCGT